MPKKYPFITFEGADGAGKTTVLTHIKTWLIQNHHNCLFTREPGGNPIAEQIRNIILDPHNNAMTKETELLLYEAARAQLVNTTINEALTTQMVICDRYTDSTYAYQGGGNQFNDATISAFNQFATHGLIPDVTIYFDIDPAIGLKRIQQNRTNKQDRLDEKALAYHQKVNTKYHELTKKYPNRIQVIDGNLPLIERIEQTKKIIAPLMNE